MRSLSFFLVPGVLVFSLFLLLGGVYFQRRGQNVLVEPVENIEGEVSGTTTEIPIYQPSVVVSRSELKDSREITFETGDASEKVVNFYERELVSQGFKRTDKAQTLGSTFLNFTHPDGRRLEVTLETEAVSGKTVATLYLAKFPR